MSALYSTSNEALRCVNGCRMAVQHSSRSYLVDGSGTGFRELDGLVLGSLGRGADDVKAALGVKLLKGVGGLDVLFLARQYACCCCLDGLALLRHVSALVKSITVDHGGRIVVVRDGVNESILVCE